MTWIDKLQRIVLKLQWCKSWLLLMALTAAGLAIYHLFLNKQSSADDSLLFSVVAMAWCFLVHGVLTGFAKIPALPDPSFPWWRRWKIRIIRGYYWLLLGLCIVTSLVAGQISWRVFSLS